MILENRKYQAFDLIRLAFKVAPGWALLTFVLRMIAALTPAALIMVIAIFIDTSLAVLEGTAIARDMYIPILLLGALTSFRWFVDIFNKYIRSKFLMATRLTYRVAIIEKRGRLEYRHIENQDTYDLIKRITDPADTQIIDQFDQTMGLIDVILQGVSLLAILIVNVWWSAILLLLFSMPAIYLGIIAGKNNYDASRDVSKIEREAYYLITEVCSGRAPVLERTLFGYGPKMSEQLWERFEAARICKQEVRNRGEIRTSVSTILVNLMAGAVSLILLQPTARGTITIGLFISIVSACVALARSFFWFPRQLETFSRNLEYLSELGHFSQLEETEGALTTACDKGFKLKKIEFKDVTFTYPGTDKLILNKVNFTITPGKHYAFVGENGAGKTTVIKLLTGQYQNYEGEILLNGKELKTYLTSELKAIFSVAYQDFAKYQISLKENILIGNLNGANDEIFDHVVRDLELDDLIAKLPKGINTPLGKIAKDGVDVSGGQWQRIALARAILNRAPIKILDEPTAALDPLSESRLYEQFEKVIDHHTSIFISHRLGSIKLADEIFVFDRGVIIEKGNHETLMKQAGKYSEMYRGQSGWYQNPRQEVTMNE